MQQAAKVEYVSVQNLSRGTWHFASHHARVERDAELDWVTGGFGSAKGKVRIQNDLAGPGATSRVTGAYFADGTQHLDYDTFQEHIAPSTTSDFAFKGALRDTARAVWRGMIRVEEGAQKTNAYQENRNLLLSKTAHADSIPGLEIMANDVRCTHGATLGQVDREQLFYLMTRGLYARRGRAPDRARLLPGRARPRRARAGARGARRRPRSAHPAGVAADRASSADDARRRAAPPGVFHLYAFVAAVVAGTLLVVLADGYLERFAVWVYAVALAAMFGASALYHRFPWRSASARLRARRLDHAMIFVFIAGTYTAFALVAFTGRLESSGSSRSGSGRRSGSS